jgi:hypothetical protein
MRKVAGAIPDGHIANFHWFNISGLAVGSAYNRNEYRESFLCVKEASSLGWQIYNFLVTTVFIS